MLQTSDIERKIKQAIVYTRVCARLCNLNNNGVTHPETICAAAEGPSFAFVPKAYWYIKER